MELTRLDCMALEAGNGHEGGRTGERKGEKSATKGVSKFSGFYSCKDDAVHQ